MNIVAQIIVYGERRIKQVIDGLTLTADNLGHIFEKFTAFNSNFLICQPFIGFSSMQREVAT